MTFAAELHAPIPGTEDAAMLEEWNHLHETDLPMWVAVGLARFAGLRLSEIKACRGKWVHRVKDATYIKLEDRESDEYWTKTGRQYSALVLHPDLADYLRALEPEQFALRQTGKWLASWPQNWARPFVRGVRKPMHRLRGVYEDHVKRETEEAILARQAAIKEASRNLGHTSVTTTERHYLSEPDATPATE